MTLGVPPPPSKDQEWTAEDWAHWAYYIALKLDWHTPPLNCDNRVRIEEAIEAFCKQSGHRTAALMFLGLT